MGIRIWVRMSLLFGEAQSGLKINIRYFHSLRRMVGKAEDAVEVNNGATVQDLLMALSKRYGEEFEGIVYSGVKQKGLPIIFLLDGRNVMDLQGLETKLVDGCTVTMMPPVAGG